MTVEFGRLIGEHEDARRDAVHIAIAPARAKQLLVPGCYVSADGTRVGKMVGIVDPFLKTVVQEGERFWIFITPGTYSNLRHDWDHPEFGHVTEGRIAADSVVGVTKKPTVPVDDDDYPVGGTADCHKTC